MPRPRTLLTVPCDIHGMSPCSSPGGCANRRVRAQLPPKKSGTDRKTRKARLLAEAKGDTK
jgi:hypothetical protein